MALKIIKWFSAIQALVQRFAGRASKLADALCVVRIALRALHRFIGGKEIIVANLLFARWRSDPVSF